MEITKNHVMTIFSCTLQKYDLVIPDGTIEWENLMFNFMSFSLKRLVLYQLFIFVENELYLDSVDLFLYEVHNYKSWEEFSAQKIHS